MLWRCRRSKANAVRRAKSDTISSLRHAQIRLCGDVLECTFDDPQRAVTPGQAAVFYWGGLCAVRWNNPAGVKEKIAAKLYSVEIAAKRYGIASIRRRAPRASQNSIQSATCAMHNPLARRCAGMHFRRSAKSCHAQTGGGVLLGRLCAVRGNDFAGMKKRVAAKFYGSATVRR